jgi:hypothetical protein
VKRPEGAELKFWKKVGDGCGKALVLLPVKVSDQEWARLADKIEAMLQERDLTDEEVAESLKRLRDS